MLWTLCTCNSSASWQPSPLSSARPGLRQGTAQIPPATKPCLLFQAELVALFCVLSYHFVLCSFRVFTRFGCDLPALGIWIHEPEWFTRVDSIGLTFFYTWPWHPTHTQNIQLRVVEWVHLLHVSLQVPLNSKVNAFSKLYRIDRSSHHWAFSCAGPR